MDQGGLVLLLGAGIAAGSGVFWGVRRLRYLRAVTAHGWTHESDPDLATILDHTAPPFGLGFDRNVDELITGTTPSGADFRTFRYRCSGGGPPFNDRVASITLSRALPDLFISDIEPRTGLDPSTIASSLAGENGVTRSLHVAAEHPAYVGAVLAGPITTALREFRVIAGQLDVGVDGQNLVAVGAPKDPDDLHRYLNALDAVRTALAATDLTGYPAKPHNSKFRFYQRPDWRLIGRDDSLIDKYALTRAGHHHSTEKVLRGDNDGLPVEAFIHRWQTTKTVHYRDSKGRRRTREVTEYHEEIITAVTLPFTVPLLSVNVPGSGRRVQFESEEFNRAFTVRTTDPKFASDLIHPRTMEYLAVTSRVPFAVSGSTMRFFPRTHDTLIIGSCADLAHGLWSRVPSFLWKDLGITPPPFRCGTGTLRQDRR